MASIVTVAGIKEPLRAYNFEVVFLWGSTEFKYQVRSVSLPSFADIDVDKIKIAPVMGIPYPTGFSIDDRVFVEFWEDVGFSVTKFMRAWLESVIDLNPGKATYGCFYLKNNYARDFEVRFLNTEGNVIKTVRIVKAFPVSIGNYDLSYGSNELVIVKVEFAYEYIDWKYEGGIEEKKAKKERGRRGVLV